MSRITETCFIFSLFKEEGEKKKVEPGKKEREREGKGTKKECWLMLRRIGAFDENTDSLG